jgi:RimJ/RimL family protein N-acetyltransferase
MIFFKDPKIEEISDFFKNNKKGQNFFRYYQKRPFSIIKNHLVTLLLKENDKTIGYGHLDLENENVWLGIMVADNHVGKGVGTNIISELLKYHNGKINLSVDDDNYNAISLYKKFNFFEINKQNNTIIMLKNENFIS